MFLKIKEGLYNLLLFSCVAVPQRPTSVTVQDRDKQSISVVWARPRPCERSPFVEFYILYWCKADEKGTECLLGKNIKLW